LCHGGRDLYRFRSTRQEWYWSDYYEHITAVVAGEREVRLIGVAPGVLPLRIQRVAYTYKDVAVAARVRLVESSQHAYLSAPGSRAPINGGR